MFTEERVAPVHPLEGFRLPSQAMEDDEKKTDFDACLMGWS